jgi:ribulose-phosphate 3-epimerase
MLIAPSILSADFGRLADEANAVCEAGADVIHVDVMDGHFVPNLTIGPLVVKAVKQASHKPLDVHLMVKNNDFFVDLFAPLRPEYITFHIEEEKHPHRLVQKIKGMGIKAGLVLNPHTNEKTLEYILDDLDIVLLMSVNPGFGGQKFIDTAVRKVESLKNEILRRGLKTLVEVDGGVNDKNAPLLRDAGADVLVAGSYVFGSEDYKAAIDSLR